MLYFKKIIFLELVLKLSNLPLKKSYLEKHEIYLPCTGVLHHEAMDAHSHEMLENNYEILTTMETMVWHMFSFGLEIIFPLAKSYSH